MDNGLRRSAVAETVFVFCLLFATRSVTSFSVRRDARWRPRPRVVATGRDGDGSLVVENYQRPFAVRLDRATTADEEESRLPNDDVVANAFAEPHRSVLVGRASTADDDDDLVILDAMDENDATGDASPPPPPLRQSLFALPVVPFLYERVLPPLWEAGLRAGGVDDEYRAAAAFLSSERDDDGRAGAVLLDASCGTGFVARRFAERGDFAHVVALDASREMLEEFVASLSRTSDDGSSVRRRSTLTVVRADAGDLPLRDESVDAIHWGAALHCVPDAERALAEMYRVTKTGGGKLYATTFLRPLPDVVFRFFTLDELEHMARDAGFRDVEVERLGPVYGVVRCRK